MKVSLVGKEGEGTQGEPEPLLLNVVIRGGEGVACCWGTMMGFGHSFLPVKCMF